MKPGETITFTAGPGAEGLIIEFTGSSNVYVYVCKGAADAAPTNPGDGGEVEVVRG